MDAVVAVTVMRLLLFVLRVYILRECDGDGNAGVGDGGGVGVCEMCMCLARGGVGVERVSG